MKILVGNFIYIALMVTFCYFIFVFSLQVMGWIIFWDFDNRLIWEIPNFWIVSRLFISLVTFAFFGFILTDKDERKKNAWAEWAAYTNGRKE